MSNTQKTNLEMIQQSTEVVCVMANDAIKCMVGMKRTPEESKKGLECCGEDGCKDCPYVQDCIMTDGFSELAKDTLCYIQQLEAYNAQQARCIENLTDKLNATNDALPRWISVEERLPEEKELVLVHYTDGWMPIAFLLNGNWYNSGGERSWLSVTHWMPLPQAPKEG